MWHKRKITGWFLLVGVVAVLAASAIDEYSSDVDPMLDATQEKTQTENAPKVTAVYGAGADDYLPLKEEARRHLRPNIRESRAHPSFDLPDAFYFIGGPIFLLILLRVLTMFLNDFEEKRKEEERVVASERAACEHVVED